jgi:hypothetical protein
MSYAYFLTFVFIFSVSWNTTISKAGYRLRLSVPPVWAKSINMLIFPCMCLCVCVMLFSLNVHKCLTSSMAWGWGNKRSAGLGLRSPRGQVAPGCPCTSYWWCRAREAASIPTWHAFLSRNKGRWSWAQGKRGGLGFEESTLGFLT